MIGFKIVVRAHEECHRVDGSPPVGSVKLMLLLRVSGIVSILIVLGEGRGKDVAVGKNEHNLACVRYIGNKWHQLSLAGGGGVHQNFKL